MIKNERLINYRAHDFLLRVISLSDGLKERISLEQARDLYKNNKSVIELALSNTSELAQNNFNDLNHWWENKENKLTSRDISITECLDEILSCELDNHIEKQYGCVNDAIHLLLSALMERLYLAENTNGSYEILDI